MQTLMNAVVFYSIENVVPCTPRIMYEIFKQTLDLRSLGLIGHLDVQPSGHFVTRGHWRQDSYISKTL